MSTPPILSSGPVIDPEVPWSVRRHLQLLYQKVGNHAQAFGLQQQQIAALKTGVSTTTNIIEGGGSSPVTPSSGFIGQGLINDQTGATAYVTQPGDNGILLILNDASPVAVTLTTDSAPFYLVITNFGAGTATLTPSSGTVNGGASLALLQKQTVIACCDSTNWETTAFSAPPQSAGPTAHQWLASYNAATGAFTLAQPAVADVSGAAPLASPTFTGVVTQPDAPVLTAATTAATATAGAGALPAAPQLFLDVTVNGTAYKIPLYLP